MDDEVETDDGVDAGGPDLAILERIEGELFAVERALEQIDRGTFDGFAGLDDRPAPQP